MKLAIFTSVVTGTTGNQNAITMVGIPTGEKTWKSITLMTQDAGNGAKQALAINGDQCMMQEPTILAILREQNIKWTLDSIGTVKRQTALVKKIDESYASKVDYESALLSDSDYLATQDTLQTYITNNFTVENTVQDRARTGVTRKMSFKRRTENWSLIRTCGLFTQAELDLVFPKIDLDIAMANDNRIERLIFAKELETVYPGRKFTAIGLHGDPGSGKTSMVMYDYCAINNIPVLLIPCDTLMTVNSILSQTGPVNIPAALKGAEVDKMIETVKNQMFLVEQSGDMAKLEALSSLLDKLINLSSKKTDLQKTPSILQRALANNIPLVVLFDEANLMPTQVQNALAATISDGTFKDGPNVYRNNYSVRWVFAWNPNTTNTKTFDGKFFDRMTFINVEKVSSDDNRKFHKRLMSKEMFGVSAADISALEAKIDKALKKDPSKAEELIILKTRIQQYAAEASKDALTWYVNKSLKDTSMPNFKKGQFVANFLDNITLDTQAALEEADDQLLRYIDKVNAALYETTVGKDTKNPDKNAFYYVANRALAVFEDYVFCMTSTYAATERFCLDLLPGGNTLVRGSEKRASDDKTPATIAKSIADKLTGEATVLDNLLFLSVSQAESDAAAAAFKDIDIVFNSWKQPEGTTPATAADGTTTTTTTTQTDLDELDQLID